MFLPKNNLSTSTLLGKYNIIGNIKISEEIKTKVFEFAKDNIDLYSAQFKIKKYLCEKYTKEWYLNNNYEVQFIIEEVYNNIERNR